MDVSPNLGAPPWRAILRTMPRCASGLPPNGGMRRFCVPAWKASSPNPSRPGCGSPICGRKERLVGEVAPESRRPGWPSSSRAPAAGWFASGLLPARSPDSAVSQTTAIARGATAAYRTFVVEVAHPVEVAATQEAHLLHWLSKRLGRPLMVPDLSRFGYRLMGGRLLPAGGAAAAQLMYDDPSGRRLTVYVRAASGTETAFRFEQEGDAATFAWIDQGFGFAVTAMASRAELLPIAEAVYHQLSGRT